MRLPLLRNLVLLMLLFAASSPTQAGKDLPPGGVGGPGWRGPGTGRVDGPVWRGPGAGRVGGPVWRGPGTYYGPVGRGPGGGNVPARGGCQGWERRSLYCDDPQQYPILGHPTGSNLVFTGIPVDGRQSGSTVGPIAILLALLGAGAGVLTWRLRGRTQKKSADSRTRLVGVPDFGRQSIRFLGNSTNVRESRVSVATSRDSKSVISSSASMKTA